MHFDIVIASSQWEAEAKVTLARSLSATPPHIKGTDPIALSYEEVEHIFSAMTFKSSEDIEKRFALNTQIL